MSKSISYDVEVAIEHGVAVAILVNNISVFTGYHDQKDNSEYWHSMKDIAASTGLSLYQVREAAKVAKEAGFIDFRQSYKPNSNVKTTYWKLVKEVKETATSESAETATSEHKETATSIYKSKRTKSKNINTNVELQSQYQPLHDKICVLFDKNPNQYKLSKMRRDKLKLRLKDNGEENILKACEAITKSPWHMGENDRSWIADPYWVLHSFEKTEEWAGRYEASGFKGNLTELEI